MPKTFRFVTRAKSTAHCCISVPLTGVSPRSAICPSSKSTGRAVTVAAIRTLRTWDPTIRRTRRLIPGSPRALADLVNLRNQEVAKNVTFVMGGRIDPYCGDLETGCGIGNATKGNTNFFEANHVQYTLPVGKVVGIDLTFVKSHPFHIHINP